MSIKKRIKDFQKQVELDYRKSLQPSNKNTPPNIQRIEWYLDEFNREFEANYDVGNIVKLIIENDVLAGMVRNKFQSNMPQIVKTLHIVRENQTVNDEFDISLDNKDVYIHFITKVFTSEHIKMFYKQNIFGKYLIKSTDSTHYYDKPNHYGVNRFKTQNPDFDITINIVARFPKHLNRCFDLLGWDLKAEQRKEQ